MDAPIKKHSRCDALDGIKVFLAIGLMLMHVNGLGFYNVFPSPFFQIILPNMYQFVFCFMTISSFSMCCGYYEKFKESDISISDFYKKRIMRIWPQFAILSLVYLCVSFSKTSIIEVFANLTLLFGFLPNNNISAISTGWFVGVLFLFYIAFPYFCFLNRNRISAWISFLASLILCYFCSVYFFSNLYVTDNFKQPTNFLYCFPFFSLGGIIFLYIDEIKKVPHFVSAMIMLVLTVVYFIYNNYITVLIFSGFLPIFSMSINSKGLLINPVVKSLSTVTLEIYLVHYLIIRILEKLGFMYISPSALVTFILFSIITIALTVLGSYVLQRICLYITGMIQRNKAVNSSPLE